MFSWYLLRLRDAGEALDILFNTLASLVVPYWGPALDGETVSLHVARMAAKKEVIGCWFCWFLNEVVETDHCIRTLNGEYTPAMAVIRSTLLFLFVLAILVLIDIHIVRLI